MREPRPSRAVGDGLFEMELTQALALFPIAQTLHVWQEWPRFPEWARRFASDRYTDREYIITHGLAVASAVAALLLARAFLNQAVIFVVFALVFGPGTACNALFHVGATLISRHYCPGAVTSIVVYIPLTLWLIVLALREGLMSPARVTTALLIAATFHAVEVGHNVFKRW